MADLRKALSVVRRALAYELHIYLNLLRWVVRRPSGPHPGGEAFGYARDVTPVMGLWIFVSACEVPLIHLLVPWDGVRIALLAVGIWGLVWMIGLLAGMRVYPHLADATTLRVRNGARVDLAVPWARVAEVASSRRDLPSSMRTLQPREVPSGTDLQVGVSGQVNVHLVLTAPTTVRTTRGPLQITELSFFVDEPRVFVARARRLIADARQETPDFRSA